MEASSSELEVTEIKKSLKILGVHYNCSLFYKLNFESTEKSIRKLLRGWGWRGLTLIGKVQIIKSFALPKILYRLTLMSNRKQFIKKINTLLYSFVWKGKDKVKRTVLISPIEKGGLKIPDVESLISSQRIICIKRYLSPSAASWKFFLDFYLRKVGGKFLFHCNFDYSKLSISLPDFYKERILSWASLTDNNLSSPSKISNQILWNNRFICITSCSVYNQKLIDSGLVTISDLYDTNGEFKGFKEPLHSNLSPIDHYLLFSLHSALPQEWRRALKVNKTVVVSNAQHVDLSSFSLDLEREKVDVEKLQSRSLYERLISKISTKPTAMKKYNEAFNTETFHLDWERIYSLPFKVTYTPS